jgi:hypothetical protein
VTIRTVKRIDNSKLGKAERTAWGGFRVPAAIARTGILEYYDADGKVIREYNPPEVVQAILDSLRDAPVTREHPHEQLTPANVGQFKRGHVSGTPVFRDGRIEADLVIDNADLIADIEAGKREEISLGYLATVDYTPGVSADGEKYDGIRTAIVPNHVAVVTQGRAGSGVRLRLDSDYGIVLDNDMDEIAKLKAKLDAAESRADAAEAAVKDLTAKLTQANDPKRLDALVSERVALAEAKAKAKKAFPKLAAKIDAADKAYVDTLLEAAPEGQPETPATEEQPAPKQDATTEVTDAAQVLSPRERMIRRNRGEKV